MPARFKLVDGIRIYPDGREVCVTRAARDRRRLERIVLAKGRCECTQDCRSHVGRRCNRLIAATVTQSEQLKIPVTHVHHKKRRGMGGATRDDRIENLEATCEFCHRSEHERNK